METVKSFKSSPFADPAPPVWIHDKKFSKGVIGGFVCLRMIVYHDESCQIAAGPNEKSSAFFRFCPVIIQILIAKQAKRINLFLIVL